MIVDDAWEPRQNASLIRKAMGSVWEFSVPISYTMSLRVIGFDFGSLVW